MPEPLIPHTTGQPLTAARVEDVFADTEEVRAADYPNVPAQLLVDVLAAERDNPDNRTAAARAVARVVDAYLLNTLVSESGAPGEPVDEGASA